MDSLIGKIDTQAVLDVLEQLPTDINTAYDEIMQRIWRQNKEHRAVAEHVLKWVICARRFLTQEELQRALAISPDTTDMNSEAFKLVDLAFFIEVCAGLVVLDENSEIIRLVRT